MLFRKTAQPLVKAPLNYSPTQMFFLELTFKICFNVTSSWSFGFGILVSADLSCPPGTTSSNIDFG